MIYLLLVACNPTEEKNNVVDDPVGDDEDTGSVSDENIRCDNWSDQGEQGFLALGESAGRDSRGRDGRGLPARPGEQCRTLPEPVEGNCPC